MEEEDLGYEASAHLYDLFDSKNNIPFFLHYGRAAGEILDVGAGTGRIAIPLAEEGVRVFCVEPSRAMRAVFKEKLSRRRDLSERITLIQGDAKGFDFDRTFSAAYLSGTFDHFLDDGERIASLVNIGKHLHIGGILIFDVFMGLMRERPVSPAGEVVEGNRRIRRFVGVQTLPEMKLEVQLVYEISGDEGLIERIEQTSYAGMIDHKRILALLKRTGFEVENEFGDYRWGPFQEGGEILIIQAAKRN